MKFDLAAKRVSGKLAEQIPLGEGEHIAVEEGPANLGIVCIGAVGELTPNDLREIAITDSKIAVQGARYPEKLEQMTGR